MNKEIKNKRLFLYLTLGIIFAIIMIAVVTPAKIEKKDLVGTWQRELAGKYNYETLYLNEDGSCELRTDGHFTCYGTWHIKGKTSKVKIKFEDDYRGYNLEFDGNNKQKLYLGRDHSHYFLKLK